MENQKISKKCWSNGEQISERKMFARSVLLVLILSLFGLIMVEMVASNPAPGTVTAIVGDENSPPAGGYNNLENLISDFLDDAGDRLKKSRMNGMRQVKQTLRFGRSDPWFVPSTQAAERMSMEELQSRLLAVAK